MTVRQLARRLLLALLAGALVACGDDVKRPPTAPAPKSIKDPPPKEMRPDRDDDDDDDDALDDDPPPRRAPMPSGMNASSAMSAQKATLNRHALGLTVKAWNTFRNNVVAFSKKCFAEHWKTKTVAVELSVELRPKGNVARAQITSGSDNKKFNKCVCDITKQISVSPFKGSPVRQSFSINFSKL